MAKSKLKHIDNGQVREYVPWDNVFTMNGRYWHACPVCGLGVCSPIEGPLMAHRACIERELNG